MEKKLTEELKQSGFHERTQLILALAPGCLFGFPPPNLDKMIERVDCPTCRKMMEIVEKISKDLTELQRKADDFCRPVRERNKVRQEAYERRRRMFIIGRFAKPGRPEAEPNYKNESWYAETMLQVEQMEAELALLSGQDTPHWGDEESKKISREVVGRFLAKDSTYTLIL